MTAPFPPPDATAAEVFRWHEDAGRRTDPTLRCAREGCGHLRTTHRDGTLPNGKNVRVCTALSCGCRDYQRAKEQP